MPHDPTVAKLAAASFKNHAIVQEGEGRWLCAKPGTNIYSFRVILAPGYVVLLGDLGELVLRHHERDSLRWLLTCPHIDYMLGKCPFRGQLREFDQAAAEQYLSEMDDLTLAFRIREAWKVAVHCDEDEAWRSSYYLATGDSEVPACDRWNDQALWQAEALLWFCRAYEAAQSPIHAVPPRGSGQCPCGSWPLEHLDHRMTADPALVTCPGCLEALRKAAL